MDARKGDRVILTRNWDYGFAGRIEKGTKGVIIEENSGVISGKSYKIKFENNRDIIEMSYNTFQEACEVI